jgi:neutral ceramidase
MTGFYQNMTNGYFGWDILKNIIRKPTAKQKKCQAPKPILLDTGEIKALHPWQPEILDIQLFRIGNVFIYAVPSEFTTMSGRRLRDSIKKSLIKHQLGDQGTVVIHSGPANGYAVCKPRPPSLKHILICLTLVHYYSHIALHLKNTSIKDMKAPR